MEQMLSGNTESSPTGTHGAAPSFCSTRSTEQHQWSIMESESTYGSSGLRSTWIEQLLPGELRAALLEHVEQWLSESRYRCSSGALWSSSFAGAHSAALLEHVEQQLHWSRYSCSTGADGAAASREHRELQLC